jgi:hypothetical protein
MRSICAFALLALATTGIAGGARAQTTPEQTMRQHHYGEIPSPTRHLGEITLRQNRLGKLRGPQGSLTMSSQTPYLGGTSVLRATKSPYKRSRHHRHWR